ncbi:HAD family hydrolase [Plesiomonas shigelloides]|uniref:HAD family hydrolase n=1 Tax=Plesiomonas shigelloides TaxID=703 RepID=UPI0012614BA2|nr:HAD family hydrolase [Plesiomonas shigelloides]KAB7693636.1 hypothetical protein GBN20_00065 [Plesiomonas shigelloides]
MIEKIIVTSDFLMTKEKEQFSNLKWLYEVLKRPIWKSTGIAIESFTSSLTDKSKLSRTDFFNLSDIKINIHETHFYYDSELISDASIEYLSSKIGEKTLIIGYELSEQTRNVINRLGLIYIDLWLHPVRFLDDVLFGISSNNKEVFDLINSFAFDNEHYWLYADKLRISAFKGWMRVIDNMKISPNSALFIGQTLEDKAVCKNGKMLNLLDFKGEFERLGKKYSTVYYSRHPFLKSGDEKILDYVKTCGFAKIINKPSYYLLSHPNIKKVASISSSVAIEAEYFGKQTEIWHQTIFDEQGPYSIRRYIPVFQDFITSYFWAKILSPIHATKECKKISFIHKKDKLRDMLGFYWSYKQVDKLEYIRNWLLAVDRRVQRIDSPKEIVKKNTEQENIGDAVFDIDYSLELKKIKHQINKHKVISFDIFDTLIVRDLAHPNDIFDLMHRDANTISDGKFENFRQVRERSRDWVDKNDSEEVNLIDRYHAIGKKFSLTQGQVNALYNLELMYELKICKPRLFGKELYDYASKKNKKIVLVSDIFFDREFIDSLLKKNGYLSHSAVFLSSEEKCLKHTGNLYPRVLKSLNVIGKDVLHFGDNYHSDIEMASKYGISAIHLERTVEQYKRVNLSFPKVLDSNYMKVITGAIGNKLHDNPFSFKRNTFFNGDSYYLGYGMLGNMFISFAKWIYEQAVKDNVDTVYFMARDGEIVKKCYDIITKDIENAPRSKYILTSRRSVNIASVKNIEDIKNLVRVNFSPCSVTALFNNRFGFNLSSYQAVLLESGFSSLTDVVKFTKDEDIDRVFLLIERIKDDLLKHCKEERDELLQYYRSTGICNNEKGAVVDIGHNGTLQRSLSLLTDKKFNGYYFCTYKDIDSNITEDLGSARGFIGERLNPKVHPHPYSNNILMFEMAFLNAQGSFVRIKNGCPVFLPVDDEPERVVFAKALHSGITDFCKDVSNIINVCDVLTIDDTLKTITPYCDFLKKPTYHDASAFMNISFENMYSCREKSILLSNASGNSLWKEGEAIIRRHETASKANIKLTRITRLISPIISTAYFLKFVDEKKYIKFKRDPYRFIIDSKFKKIRNYIVS